MSGWDFVSGAGGRKNPRFLLQVTLRVGSRWRFCRPDALLIALEGAAGGLLGRENQTTQQPTYVRGEIEHNKKCNPTDAGISQLTRRPGHSPVRKPTPQT